MINVLLDKSNKNYEIAKIAEDKEYYDVAMSRYYYALFQKVNFLLRKNYDKFKEPNDREDSHASTFHQLNVYVARKCKHLKYEDIADIATTEDLKRYRVQADYKLRITEKEEFQMEFKKKFDPCIKVIDSLL